MEYPRDSLRIPVCLNSSSISYCLINVRISMLMFQSLVLMNSSFDNVTQRKNSRHVLSPRGDRPHQKKFENAALFLRFDLPSTLIRHENGAFRKRSSNRRNLKTPLLCFSTDRKTFWKRSFSKTMTSRWSFDFPASLFLKHKSKLTGDWCILTFSGVMWTENIWPQLFKGWITLSAG